MACVGELSAYEADLPAQWARYVDRLTYEAEFSGNLEEDAACVRFGRRVLDWVETASFPIRAAMPPKDEYLTRGTFHLLANEDLPAVYWHPKLLDGSKKARGGVAEWPTVQEPRSRWPRDFFIPVASKKSWSKKK